MTSRSLYDLRGLRNASPFLRTPQCNRLIDEEGGSSMLSASWCGYRSFLRIEFGTEQPNLQVEVAFRGIILSITVDKNVNLNTRIDCNREVV